MSAMKVSLRSSAHFLLGVLGAGTAGSALSTLVPNDVFARQFLDKGEQIRLPNMVYDPVLQMMVDPDTRQPVYSNSHGGKFRTATAVVTSGCGNCPKNDGCKDNYGC